MHDRTDRSRHGARTTALTLGALVAFAANSLLCRTALGGDSIDAASFTTVRLLSGTLILWLVARLGGRITRGSSGSWGAAVALFAYACAFSYAYLSLAAGTGALILFGAVQATMILAGLWGGERPPVLEWLGLAAALGGLVYLVLPGVAAPSAHGSALMALAGVAWGVYSLLGRRPGDPIAATAANFARALPFAVAVSLVAMPAFGVTSRGVLLAALSGGVASGLGYVAWYAALRGLTATRAATVQLSVPVLAAAGGVAFLSEAVSFRLVLSAAAILGGIGLAVSAQSRQREPVAADATRSASQRP